MLFPPDYLETQGEKSTVKVIGLDTDSNGYSWVANFIFAEDRYGWIQCKHKDANDRRNEYTRAAFSMFRSLPPGSHVFCEEPLSLRNGKTNRILGLAAGAIYGAYVIANPDATWHWVDVAHWKKEVVGNGNANKERIRLFVRDHPRFQDEWMDHVTEEDFEKKKDLYDAWCLMRYGVTQTYE